MKDRDYINAAEAAARRFFLEQVSRVYTSEPRARKDIETYNHLLEIGATDIALTTGSGEDIVNIDHVKPETGKTIILIAFDPVQVGVRPLSLGVMERVITFVNSHYEELRSSGVIVPE